MVSRVRALESTANLVSARVVLSWYYAYLNPVITEAWYLNLFRERSSEKYCADFSNTYAFLDAEGWKLVKQLCENIRVLYTLRDPLERLWSHIKFHSKFTRQSHTFDDWREADFAHHLHSNQHLLRPGEYAATLRTLSECLADHEYRVLFLDDFEARPAEALSAIEAFLGVEHIEYQVGELQTRVNATTRDPVPDALRLAALDLIESELCMLDNLGISYPVQWRASLAQQ